MKFLLAEEQPIVPWKNGGGLTREIAMHIDPAIHPDFLWRLNIATISKNGPFSSFDGIDRTIALLSGNGVVLRSPDGDIRLAGDIDPHSFAGERSINAEVVAGETTDLNMMTRRGYFRHSMEKKVINRSIAVDGDCDETIIVLNGNVTAKLPSGHFFGAPMDVITGIKAGNRVYLYPEGSSEVFIIRLTHVADQPAPAR